jgi:hypothetical protein
MNNENGGNLFAEKARKHERTQLKVSKICNDICLTLPT